MTVVTRFAPSPTGFLHIGGARTALFNWLFARHHGGRFLLRIEDTDRKRSTQAAIDAIFDGLTWLGLEADGAPTFQFERRDRHGEVARLLLEQGHAYLCYATPDELTAMREQAKAENRFFRYDGRWRDRDPAEAPAGVDPVIRLKAPLKGETVIEDAVQGRVVVANAELDDMVLLRADGTPTYMLSVVVDDHDSGVTHVIRGDDHLNNAFRQLQLYRALGWAEPVHAHVPLIHGPDGAKLSKRHGALGVDAYREMGFLPEALCNYLLRLGWAHGDDEIISRDRAIQWFGLDGVGRSPARLDLDKLAAVNAHYLRASSNERLVDLIKPHLRAKGHRIDGVVEARLLAGMDDLKPRAKDLLALADAAEIYAAARPLGLVPKAAKLLDEEGKARLAAFLEDLEDQPFQAAALEGETRALAERLGVGLGKIAQPLRAALTGRVASPGLFEVMEVLGLEEVRGRLQDALEGRNPILDP
ncbi:MAG: glutamate--tRNA ligase [Geminicoccaceae bacterium]